MSGKVRVLVASNAAATDWRWEEAELTPSTPDPSHSTNRPLVNVRFARSHTRGGYAWDVMRVSLTHVEPLDDEAAAFLAVVRLGKPA